MTFAITVQPRGKEKIELLRQDGFIPAVVYGPDRAALALTIPAPEFKKLYTAAGVSTLIDLQVEGEKAPNKVLIQEVQTDPLRGDVIHVDFRQINMAETMEAEVELSFVGDAPAVKGLGGTLIKPRAHVKIKCLPNDLVSSITVDLTALATFEDSIHVKDISVPQGITILDAGDSLVAKVAPPLTEEQLKAMEETGPKSVEEVEVEKKGKKEEEGEEGAVEGGAPAAAPAKAKEEKK